MTKMYLIMLLTFCSFIIQAQTNDNMYKSVEHLKFLGLDIDGPISNFHKEIESKEFLLNEYESDRLASGQLLYNGKYNSHQTELTVYFNRKTSTVYKLEMHFPFDSLETAQKFLDSCIYVVENRYSFVPNHDLDDVTNMYYRYGIQEQNSSNTIGTITINPTTSYFISEGGEIVGSQPTIIILCEDKKNSSLLTPSTTEPSVSFGLIANDSCFFEKNYDWAMKYKENRCYKEYKFRLDWLLNCYKYDYGVPDIYKDKEAEIEKEFINVDSHYYCNIKTAYSGGSEVYRFANPKTNDLDCIVFELGGWHRYIKLNKKQILDNIAIFDRLVDLYKLRLSEALKKTKYFRTEKMNIIPVTYGEEILSEGFGSIQWKDLKLCVKFELDGKRGLKMHVSHDYTSVFFFWSAEDILEYKEFLTQLLHN